MTVGGLRAQVSQSVLPRRPILEPLLPWPNLAIRRIWAPFDGHRHDSWVRLPAHLTAEVTLAISTAPYLVSPPTFSGGDSSSRLTWARRGFTQPRL